MLRRGARNLFSKRAMATWPLRWRGARVASSAAMLLRRRHYLEGVARAINEGRWLASSYAPTWRFANFDLNSRNVYSPAILRAGEMLYLASVSNARRYFSRR